MLNLGNYDFILNPSGFVYSVKNQLINLTAPSSTFSAAVVASSSITKDSRYEDENAVAYNAGNITDVKPRTGDTVSYIWDYKNTIPISQVANAPSNQIACTSFEADGKGNWNNYTGTITKATTSSAMPPTGVKYYNLKTTATLSKAGIITGKKYIVSYWSKNGSYSITGGSGSVITGKLINGWTYYEHSVIAIATTITISGTGAIDEVRLYPAEAHDKRCDLNKPDYLLRI